MFVVGDSVILKSGGPEMTVSAVEDGYCSCVWFDFDADGTGPWLGPFTFRFPIDTLKMWVEGDDV